MAKPRASDLSADYLRRNGKRADNRICNLREASYALNSQNVTKIRSKAGFLGVVERKHGYEASIKVRGKSLHLGTYPTPRQASRAYETAKRKHHGVAVAAPHARAESK